MSCSKNYPKDPKLQIENFTIELEVEILIGIEFLLGSVSPQTLSVKKDKYIIYLINMYYIVLQL